VRACAQAADRGELAAALRGAAKPAAVAAAEAAMAESEAALEAYLREHVTPLFRHVTSYKQVLVEEYLVEVPVARLREVGTFAQRPIDRHLT
jgi:hypothetical protein